MDEKSHMEAGANDSSHILPPSIITVYLRKGARCVSLPAFQTSLLGDTP